MDKQSVKKWIGENHPLGFITSVDNKLNLDEDSNLFLKSDIEIIDEDFEENRYVLILSDEKIKPKIEEITYIFTYCKLKKIRKAVIVQISEEIEEIDFLLEGIHIRNIKFDKRLELNEAGSEFCDELFDE